MCVICCVLSVLFAVICCCLQLFDNVMRVACWLLCAVSCDVFAVYRLMCVASCVKFVIC